MAPTGFSKTQITLHWITAGLVLLQLVLPEAMEQAFEQSLKAGTYVFTGGGIAHMVSGTVVLALVLWRLILRNERGVPPAPDGEPAWGKTASVLAHWGFYVLLILLPISGGVAWGLMSETAAGAHDLLKSLLILLILAHVGAVLVHQFVWKTNIMDRMRRASD